MFSSRGLAGDERPLVELNDVERVAVGVRLSGTACAFEGNVLVESKELGEEWVRRNVQASVGGPSRGAFSIEIPVQIFPVLIRIGDEDARDGGILGASLVECLVDDSGQAVQQL